MMPVNRVSTELLVCSFCAAKHISSDPELDSGKRCWKVPLFLLQKEECCYLLSIGFKPHPPTKETSLQLQNNILWICHVIICAQVCAAYLLEFYFDWMHFDRELVIHFWWGMRFKTVSTSLHKLYTQWFICMYVCCLSQSHQTSKKHSGDQGQVPRSKTLSTHILVLIWWQLWWKVWPAGMGPVANYLSQLQSCWSCWLQMWMAMVNGMRMMWTKGTWLIFWLTSLFLLQK